MLRAIVCHVICGVALVGCSGEFSGNQYEASSVGEIQRAEHGTVVSMRKVKLKPNDMGYGTVLGATGGAIAGALIGKGDNKYITGAAGAVLGGVAGHAIENRQKPGVEYTVKLDTGGTIVIAQGPEPAITMGQRVYIIQSEKGRSRIVPE